MLWFVKFPYGNLIDCGLNMFNVYIASCHFVLFQSVYLNIQQFAYRPNISFLRYVCNYTSESHLSVHFSQINFYSNKH